ncbi:MAG: hypothetical protein AAB385_08360 [Planctomycetota bacterium]
MFFLRSPGQVFPTSPAVVAQCDKSILSLTNLENLAINYHEPSQSATWRNTEEFIEDRYPIDIRHTLKIDCEFKQNGFREHFLTEMLARAIPLLANKKLTFSITRNTVPWPYQIKWKVLNRGEEAQKRDMIRGEIVDDKGHNGKTETTNFRGDHVVECYVIKDGVVVAKDRIHVPINTNA